MCFSKVLFASRTYAWFGMRTSSSQCAFDRDSSIRRVAGMPPRESRVFGRSVGQFVVGAAFALSALLPLSPARAVEGGIFGGPLGGTDIRSAYLPGTPGFYAAVVGLSSRSNKYLDQNGGYSVANPAYFTAFGEGGSILYVYPYHPLGFTVASSFQLVYAETAQAITAGGIHRSGGATGFLDSFGDLFFASRYMGLYGAQQGGNARLNYGLTFAFGLGAEFPLGAYAPNQFPTTGKNTFITIPSVAFTYLTGPNLALPGADGTEISTRLFFDVVSRNPASGVQSGNIFDIDYAVTERFGNLQAGFAGAFAQQLNNDITAAGLQAMPAGNRLSRTSVGGVLAYDSPELKTTFKLKTLYAVDAHNSYPVLNMILSASFKLF